MESLKQKINHLPLRRFFVLAVLLTVLIVTIVSGLIIWGCVAFRNYLLPDSNAVYLTIEQTLPNGNTVLNTYMLGYNEEPQEMPYLTIEEIPVEGTAEDSEKGITEESANDIAEDFMQNSKYAVKKIEKSYENLTPKRKLAYQVCGIAMVAVPVLLSFIGILVCGFYFYRKKLAEPIQVLAEATEQIASQNLDFTIEYENGDEMGQLCHSFEQMREALCENNKTMWAMLEERKLLQASIAHDLRNPIAIIEGYTEYLQLNIESKKLNQDKIFRIVNNLHMSAKRLEHYTESVRALNQMEDMEIERKKISAANLVEELVDDLGILAAKHNISLQVRKSLPEGNVYVDSAVWYRILENICSNAVRFAKSTVWLEFLLENHNMIITITDDGKGFPEEILERNEKLFLPTQQEEGHLGMGLAVSRLLCKKHGGSLEIANNKSHHAVVKIKLSV